MAMQRTNSKESVKKRLGGVLAAVSVVLLLAACDPSAGGTGTGTGTPSASVTTSATASATPASPAASLSSTPSAVPTSATPTPAATTEAPAVKATPPTPAAAPPAPTRTRTQAPAPEPTKATTDCYPRSNAGNCYKAGQICRKADVGTSGRDANGRAIHCRLDSSVGQRWGY